MYFYNMFLKLILCTFYLDDVNLGIFNDGLPHCGSVTEWGIRNLSSPEISAEFSGQTGIRTERQELSMDKGTNLDKEHSWSNSPCSQYRRTEKQTRLMKKCPKKPAWNINKPLTRYVPASAKYPAHLQKEKEEKRVRRQMELLHLVERNNPENLSQNRGTSPEIFASSHREAESEMRLHLIKKVNIISMFLNSQLPKSMFSEGHGSSKVGYRKLGQRKTAMLVV